MQDFGAQVTRRKKDIVRKVKYYIQTKDNEKTTQFGDSRVHLDRRKSNLFSVKGLWGSKVKGKEVKRAQMFLWMSLWENSQNLVACHGQARFFFFF